MMVHCSLDALAAAFTTWRRLSLLEPETFYSEDEQDAKTPEELGAQDADYLIDLLGDMT